MVLILIHHRVEAKNGSQIDNLLLRGIVQRMLVLLAHIDGDLFLRVNLTLIPWWWHPFLATHCALYEGLELRLVWRLDGLLVNVLDELFAIQRPSCILGALIAATLIWWQEVVLQNATLD